MSSVITVGAGGSSGTVSPPSTGDAGLAATHSTSMALYGFAAVVALGFVAGAGALRVKAARS